mmetsp:Transcript_62133/g.109417  ORF Transcript_62133/g.109417 Transcript_62133/m.109417 type:complete len:210 (-) Transcript_62133:1817-2446(-)
MVSNSTFIATKAACSSAARDCSVAPLASLAFLLAANCLAIRSCCLVRSCSSESSRAFWSRSKRALRESAAARCASRRSSSLSSGAPLCFPSEKAVPSGSLSWFLRATKISLRQRFFSPDTKLSTMPSNLTCTSSISTSTSRTARACSAARSAPMAPPLWSSFLRCCVCCRARRRISLSSSAFSRRAFSASRRSFSWATELRCWSFRAFK